MNAPAIHSYRDFLRRKAVVAVPTGLSEIPTLPKALFPFQADIVRWSLRRGRAALFAGTGLGKSLMELAWGHALHQARGIDVLLVTPLAVAAQMVREAKKFDIPTKQCREHADVVPGISITNYEKLDRFDIGHFGAIILDESSILKAQDGKTRTKLIQACQSVPFRLAATATPAPNDFMELGNHAEFLGVMSYTDMLATFFTHDGSETQKWRLKGHAEEPFWRWMASWSVMLTKPSDLGYEDGAFNLPPLFTHQHIVAVPYEPSAETGLLFPVEARTMKERLGARRDSISDRVQAAAALVNGNDRPWVVWCHLNAESEALASAIPGAVEIRGSDKEEDKERKILDFVDGRTRVSISKPSILGFGLNLQHCRDTVFVGLSDSFEQVFQAVRRFWRFGQTEPVNVHFIAAETEGAVVSNIRRKEAQAERMVAQMIRQTADITSAEIRGTERETADYRPTAEVRLPAWIGRNG